MHNGSAMPPAGNQRSLEIHNFKCFPELRLDRVGDLNLIAGKNNIGKSTVLEAVAVLANGLDPAELFSIVDQREQPANEAELNGAFKRLYGPGTKIDLDNRYVAIDFPSRKMEEAATGRLNWIEYRKDPTSKIAPSFSLSSSRTCALDLNFESRTAAYAGTFRSNPKIFETRAPFLKVAELRANSKLTKELWDETNARPAEDDLLDLLRVLEPRVKRIVLSSAASNPQFKIRLDNETDIFPISRFGDGLSRLVYLGLALVNCRGGYLLVDEIEDGLHYSLFPQVWDFLFQVCKRLNVTLFATTHSLDAATTFSAAALKHKDSLGVLTRLQRQKGVIVPVQFSEEEAFFATQEGLEVR